MGTWSELLDSSVAGTDAATHLAALRLPMLDGWERGHVWATWPVEEELFTPVAASLFGGYIGCLSDHLLALAAFTVLEDDEAFATSELHVHFFRPVREGTLRVDARVISRGRRTVYCEATITSGSGALVARAGATQVIREETNARSCSLRANPGGSDDC